MAQSNRPFITCHVLETVSGKPAPGINVSLRLLSPTPTSVSSITTPPVFNAVTNSDGRVTEWTSITSSSSSTTLQDAIIAAKAVLERQSQEEHKQMTWSITFQTGDFYGAGKTFWPEVELKFFTRLDQAHYHVPLLLGPWSYTTYRGS